MFYAIFYMLLFSNIIPAFFWITFQCNLNLHRKPRSMLCVVRMCSHKLYYSAPTEMGPRIHFVQISVSPSSSPYYPIFLRYWQFRFTFSFIFAGYFYEWGTGGFRNTISQDALIPSLINDKTTQVTVFPFWPLHLPLASTSLSGVQTFYQFPLCSGGGGWCFQVKKFINLITSQHNSNIPSVS